MLLRWGGEGISFKQNRLNEVVEGKLRPVEDLVLTTL